VKTAGVRIYGKRDLRLEEFELPSIKNDEILVKIISDSLCMSSFKATELGETHKRVPDNVSQNPTVIGHECCGEIIEVGEKWQNMFAAGQKFSIQPAMATTQEAIGYSFEYMGGNMLYGIIPACYIEQGCVLPYSGESFFEGSLAEPLSCVIGAAHASYHTDKGSYIHKMEIKKAGKTAILAGAGPMGLALIDYLLHREHRPSLITVSDISAERLARAQELLSPQMAKTCGVELVYINTEISPNPVNELLTLSGGGFDDVFVFTPVQSVVTLGDAILAHDGCLNFFAGPTDTAFSGMVNFYNVHYNSTHIVGTSGGNTEDMLEALDMSAKQLINPAILITHIGGLDAVISTTLNLPDIPGGKKLIYNHISLPLTAISDFAEKGKTMPIFKALDEICSANNGLWCCAAEEYLLANAPVFAYYSKQA